MNLLYILMFLSLWTIGILFLTQNFRQYFWIGIIFLSGGMASFTFSVHLTIMPLLRPYPEVIQAIGHPLYLMSVVAMTIYFYLFPYAFAVSGAWMGAIRSAKARKLLALLLAAPPAGLLAAHLVSEPWNGFEVSRFRWLAGLHFGLGCLFYFAAYFRETHYHVRKAKLRAAILFSCAIMWAFSTDFIGFESLRLGEWSFELKSNGAWQFNVLVILALVAAVLFYTVKYGFLGIKLRIERERLDYSMRALTMGVSILNHSIKNEIQKINYLAEKTKGYIEDNQTDKSLQSLEQVHAVTSHLLLMVNRVKEKADDIALNEQPCSVRELASAAEDAIRPLLESRGAAVTLSLAAEGELRADPVHLKEMLSNLLHNALDAVPPGEGAIGIRSLLTKKHFILEVKDNGSGIPKEDLARIFEPFYTTKKNTLSHGLGLSYCASVMQKHGGRIGIPESEPGKGTTVALYFPRARFAAHADLKASKEALPSPALD